MFTELLPKNDILSFGKVRASWAQVGKDADAYATLTYLEKPINYGGYTGVGNVYTKGNSSSSQRFRPHGRSVPNCAS